IIFFEPSCLSAIREDAPSFRRGDLQDKARIVAERSKLFEEFVNERPPPFRQGPPTILLHGHCHQKAMGLLHPAHALLSRLPGTTVGDRDAGCGGVAVSCGYAREHFDVSKAIAERKLLPAVRQCTAESVVVASG